jgi:hypothetical protein
MAHVPSLDVLTLAIFASISSFSLYPTIDLQYRWLDYAVGDAVRLIAHGIAPRLAPVTSGGGFFVLPRGWIPICR